MFPSSVLILLLRKIFTSSFVANLRKSSRMSPSSTVSQRQTSLQPCSVQGIIRTFSTGFLLSKQRARNFVLLHFLWTPFNPRKTTRTDSITGRLSIRPIARLETFGQLKCSDLVSNRTRDLRLVAYARMFSNCFNKRGEWVNFKAIGTTTNTPGRGEAHRD